MRERSVEPGESRMGDRVWRMELGVWGVESGLWGVELDEWSVKCGAFGVEGGVRRMERRVGSGAWSVECRV